MSSNSTKKRRVAADGTDGTESAHDCAQRVDGNEINNE